MLESYDSTNALRSNGNQALVVEASFELSLHTSFDVLFRPLHGTLGFIVIPVNHCQISIAPSVFYFSDDSLILCYSSRAFVLYSHYDDSISSKKLNVHQAFESMSLSGALIFLLKQRIS